MQPHTEHDLDRLFQALADRTRRSILRQVARGERTISDIAKPHDLTFAAVSKHLKVLEAAGLVARRRDGSFQMISLNPEALKPASEWLAFYRQFWAARLDALKSLFEKPSRKRKS